MDGPSLALHLFGFAACWVSAGWFIGALIDALGDRMYGFAAAHLANVAGLTAAGFLLLWAIKS